MPRPKILPPFFGGAIGFFSYDLSHHIEVLPHRAKDDLQSPDLFLAFFETVLAIDHLQKMLYLIFSPTPEKFFQSDRTLLYQQAQDKLHGIESRLFTPTGSNFKDFLIEQPRVLSLQATLTREEYIQRVKHCQDYISRGDIFQANLSIRYSMPLQSYPPQKLYSVLRLVNPAPFAAYLDLGRIQLISSSPERLVHVSEKMIETRPIAGTRPRGKNRVEDKQMKVDLITNTKERAEHLMLVDLERNDIGKVCEYGSIRVDELMATECYSHVMHIVSNIHGVLKDKISCFDILRAVFPGGTVTGVPKVRSMEIIDELEPVTRGPYTGSIGYISFAGDMDLNIIIRSFLMKEGTVHFQVGAGIVADSDPDREYQECLHKAEALLKTVRMSSCWAKR
jgi:anthranilate/para-aminobenzoate synthase component I